MLTSMSDVSILLRIYVWRACLDEALTLRGHNGLPSFDITGCLLAFQMLCFESTLFQSQHDIIDAFFAHSR